MVNNNCHQKWKFVVYQWRILSPNLYEQMVVTDQLYWKLHNRLS